MKTEYITLLRGINVSGKNKVPMAQLKKCFESLSFEGVKTYLNSGNVVFSSDETDTCILMHKIEDEIRKIFGFHVPSYVIAREQLSKILSNAPAWWGDGNQEIYHNLIFIIPPLTFAEVYDAIGEPKEDLEKIEPYKNVIFWSFDRRNYQKTNWWSKTATGDIKNSLTIRTANTVLKLISK